MTLPNPLPNQWQHERQNQRQHQRPNPLLKPVLALVDRLRTSTRLTVLAAVLLVPGIVATWSFASVVAGQIEFSQAERDGIVVLHPALDVLLATVNGEQVDLSALTAAVGAHPELGLADALVAARDAATALASARPDPSGAAAGARATLAAALADLVTQDGNNSNLILDPDLDSFYVMDSLIVQLPKALVVAAQAAQAPTGDASSRVAVQAVRAGALSSAADAIRSDVATATKHTARTSLSRELTSLAGAADSAGTLAHRLSSSLGAPASSDPRGVAVAVRAAADPASAALDGLLEARIAGLDARRSWTLGVTICAFLLAGWLAVAVWWRTRHDVGLTTAAVTALAAGHTAVLPLPGGRDELGDIGRALELARTVIEQQNADLRQAQAAREQQLQEDSDNQRRTQQAVRDRAQRIVDDTAEVVLRELDGVSGQVGAAREAAGTIDERVKAADAITRAVVDQTHRAVEVVDAVGRSLREVGGMAQLIAGVADQTKLLALNATIEAARAGEAGRGFSVVAAEVKELAMTTARSTEEITSTVGSLERDAAAMATVFAGVSERISRLDETTEILSNVALEQNHLVDRLGASLREAMERVQAMSQLTPGS